jgi:DNA-binding protein HU-beta
MSKYSIFTMIWRVGHIQDNLISMRWESLAKQSRSLTIETLFYILYYSIMTKTQLIDLVAKKLGVTKRLAGDFITVFVTSIVDSVKKGGEVRIQGFGTFKSSKREARTGVNPRNPKQKIKIPAMKVATFKAGSDFKKAVRSGK